MIVYEVKRPRKEPQYPIPYHKQAGLFERLREHKQKLESRGGQGPMLDHGTIAKELREAGTLETHSTMPPVGMGKHQYNAWLNAHVYPNFPKGTPVTFKNMPLVLNEPPKVWFYVVEIQEIHYMVQMDKDTREPKCVGISNASYGMSGIPVWYPPALLRNLKPSEVEAIDRLRNQESQGRDLSATVNRHGEAVVVDRNTGEIIQEE